MRFFLLGTPIDVVEPAAATAWVVSRLREPGTAVVTTPNPEMLVDARRDPAFSRALSGADLALPDGMGIVLGAAIVGRHVRRFPGVDAMVAFIEAASAEGVSMCLLGAAQGVGDDAAAALRRRFPGARITAVHGGEVREDGGRMRVSRATEEEIRAASPALLFVAFGHGKQERWMADNRAAFPSVKLMMGVGGALDVIAGRVPRAPIAMRRLGLEWLWRLGIQPWRAKRIAKAVLIFPWLVLADAVQKKGRK